MSVIWLIAILCLDGVFIFGVWSILPSALYQMSLLLLLANILCISIPLLLSYLYHRHTNHLILHYLHTQDPYTLSKIPHYLQPSLQKITEEITYANIQEEKTNASLYAYASFIESWVHEIKKPLSLLQLLIENRHEEMSPLVKSRLNHISTEMRIDVDKILYFMRLGTVKKDYKIQEVSLQSLIQDALIDNGPLLEEAGFMVQTPTSDSIIKTDERGLLFILSQLISNSVKYQSSNPTLTFCIEEVETKSTLSISDNGQGISKADLPFIFDKGFTGEKGSYLSRSTGMGLYLVKGMCDALTIEIDVDSTLGLGTTFKLIFNK